MSQKVYQYGLNRATTANYQVVKNACILERVDGYCEGVASTNCWLQLFDSLAAPSTNDVPNKSLFVNESNGFSYTFLEEDDVAYQNGVWLALSSDETKFVAVADGAVVSGDITVEDLTGVTSVSTSNTTADTYSVWGQADGFNRLLRLVVSDSTLTTTRYLQLFAYDAPITAGLVPIGIWPVTVGMLNKILSFGKDFVPQQTLAGVAYKGCVFVVSTTAGTYTDANESLVFRGFYTPL